MPRIVKIKNVNMPCFTPHEADRFPNVYLGKNCRIITNNVLKKDPRLNQFFNNETMGALDNYAHHENLNIYIKPLENDMFNDVAVSVYKNREEMTRFPLNIAKTKEEVPEFFRELYNKIHKAVYPSAKSFNTPKVKHTKLGDAKMYFENIIERYNDARLSILNKFED